MARTAEANKLRCRAWHADNKERVNAKKRARYNADPAYADANRTRAKAWRAAIFRGGNAAFGAGMSVAGELCGRCREGAAITVIVEGARLCAVCRDKWLAEESEDWPSLSAAWPCGHPKTRDNTQSIGKAGLRCRECRRKIARESARKMRAEDPQRIRENARRNNAKYRARLRARASQESTK